MGAIHLLLFDALYLFVFIFKRHIIDAIDKTGQDLKRFEIIKMRSILRWSGEFQHLKIFKYQAATECILFIRIRKI